MPEIISDFFLSAFMNGMRHQGYCTFVVEGDLPNLAPDVSASADPLWHTVSRIVQVTAA
ncbi:MAG: hypothetical protein EOO68_28650, partial [Moraxellaceae bacterium]